MTKCTRLASITLLLAATATTSVHAQSFHRTIIVPATADRFANGLALVDALENIVPEPDAENSWLVKLEPGIYDVGNTPVSMKEYVDIEGSGIAATSIYGSVAPPDGFRLGGLVEGASNAELRSLTVACESDAARVSCQGLSLERADLRVTNVRFLTRGTGRGSHWGIRTFDSHPTFRQVEIHVTAENAEDNYGIVYGGSSKLDIDHSRIVARGASYNNFAIVLREDLQNSSMKDSSAFAEGGTNATAIALLNYESHQTLSLEDSVLSGSGGINASTGISIESPASGRLDIWIRGGRIHGDTDGINLAEADSNVLLVNSEVFGKRRGVAAVNVRIASTWLRGGGSVDAQTVRCAAVYDDDFNFHPNRCPRPAAR